MTGETTFYEVINIDAPKNIPNLLNPGHGNTFEHYQSIWEDMTVTSKEDSLAGYLCDAGRITRLESQCENKEQEYLIVTSGLYQLIIQRLYIV